MAAEELIAQMVATAAAETHEDEDLRFNDGLKVLARITDEGANFAGYLDLTGQDKTDIDVVLDWLEKTYEQYQDIRANGTLADLISVLGGLTACAYVAMTEQYDRARKEMVATGVSFDPLGPSLAEERGVIPPLETLGQ